MNKFIDYFKITVVIVCTCLFMKGCHDNVYDFVTDVTTHDETKGCLM